MVRLIGRNRDLRAWAADESWRDALHRIHLILCTQKILHRMNQLLKVVGSSFVGDMNGYVNHFRRLIMMYWSSFHHIGKHT